MITLMLIKSHCPKMVTFDMKGTVDTFFTHASQKKLTDAQSQQLATRFTQTLDNTLRDYQQKNQVVILVSPAVVVGAPEVTKTIQRQVAIKMREHQQ
ncbi:type-F conjugative transfer system protein TrbI [Arsenophonus sp. PmNCSU2021_1]|uniref:type-F conjugative transfer system protein TrbI n=1 Tax=Arsenophonus sp. PmNCSU2021_1 TaxID=3118989 RepID=UPI002FF3A933